MKRLRKINPTWVKLKTQYQQRERTEVLTLRIHAITARIQDMSLVIVKSYTIESKEVWPDQSIPHKRVQENR